MKPELISFKLCPFVQRSVIVLLEKNAEFSMTYIDLDNPPPWFNEISPLGKVPVLRVGETVLFESAVIMEYLDEVTPPSLQPADPLRKAQNRAWFEVGSAMFFAQYKLTRAADRDAFEQQQQALRQDLERLEQQVAGPYFNGENYQLVDAAFAPFFLRNELLEQWYPTDILSGLTKVASWQSSLLDRSSTRASVVEGFGDLLRQHIAAGDGYGAQVYRG